MIKYPISKDYVSHWTIYDAIRELLQNAIDSDTQLERTTLEIKYENNNLIIRNEAILDRKSLLLGNSSKRDDNSTIGNYGEGYKIASLVLSRNEKQINIFSDLNVFSPKIQYDKDFDAEILVIEESETFNPNYTEVIVNNITEDEYKIIVNNCLLLQSYDKIIINNEEILTDGIHKGKIFIKGLYVCTKKNLQYGYNFNPSTLRINRDRNITEDFDTQWATSKLWNNIDESLDYKLLELININCPDVSYLNSQSYNKRDLVYTEFRKEYGNSIPITHQYEKKDYIAKGYKESELVIVPEIKRDLIKSSSNYSLPKPKIKQEYRKNMKPKDALLSFQMKYKDNLSSEQLKDIEELLQMSNNWRYKTNLKIVNLTELDDTTNNLTF